MKQIFQFKPVWLLEILFVLVGFILVIEYRKTNNQKPTEIAEADSVIRHVEKAASSTISSLKDRVEENSSVLKLEDAVICLDIDQDNPILVKSSFDKNVDYLFCHTTISGPNNGFRLIHRWLYQGQQVAEYKLSGKGMQCKLWSKKEMTRKWPGDWQVRIGDENDNQIGLVSFTLY
jgi:hypothetical protein